MIALRGSREHSTFRFHRGREVSDALKFDGVVNSTLRPCTIILCWA